MSMKLECMTNRRLKLSTVVCSNSQPLQTLHARHSTGIGIKRRETCICVITNHICMAHPVYIIGFKMPV